jgi:hypothetical protein
MEEEYHRYLFSYYHNNAWWSLVIPATSEDDARERINKLPLARLDGTLEMEIPAVPGIGHFVRIACWWKNRAYRRKKLLKTQFFT